MLLSLYIYIYFFVLRILYNIQYTHLDIDIDTYHLLKSFTSAATSAIFIFDLEMKSVWFYINFFYWEIRTNQSFFARSK